MRRNNKMTENDMGKVWVQNLVILGWFPNSTRFHAKTREMLTRIFFRIVLIGNNKKWTKKNLVMFRVQKQFN